MLGVNTMLALEIRQLNLELKKLAQTCAAIVRVRGFEMRFILL